MGALTKFQKFTPVQDPLSYYRITSSCLYQILYSIYLIVNSPGIHGDPNAPWNGVGSPQGPSLSSWWCAHNKSTFSTWHRPYLALFEVCEARMVALLVDLLTKFL
jgi:hypothetical protein